MATSVGTLLASGATFATVWEMRQQRKEAAKPDLAITTLHFVGKETEGWVRVPAAPESDLKLVNIGLGAAKNLRATWKIDYKKLEDLGAESKLPRNFRFIGGELGLFLIGEKWRCHTTVEAVRDFDICRVSKDDDDFLSVRIPTSLEEFVNSFVLHQWDKLMESNESVTMVRDLFGSTLEVKYQDTLENNYIRLFRFALNVVAYSETNFQAYLVARAISN